MRKAGFWSAIAIVVAMAASGPVAATTTFWLSTNASGTPIPGDTLTVAPGANVQLYCFLSSDGVGNTFDVMVGYDTSINSTYGSGKPANDGVNKKLTLVSAKSDILASMPAAYNAFTSTVAPVFDYSDKRVVLDASGREDSNGSLGGRPYGFVGRAAKRANELPGGPAIGQVQCFAFTLKNNMSGTASQCVVLSNLTGGNSYSTAWKHGTTLFEDAYVLTVVNGSNLSTVGATNKTAATTIMGTAGPKYNWVFWGKVSAKDANGFDIDDGSGVVIHVVAPGNITAVDGHYVSVKGSISGTTLTATQVSPY